MTFIRSIRETRASLENPSTNLSDPAAWAQYALGGAPTDSNISVTERNALSITAFWSAVGTISDTMGLLPAKLIEKTSTGETLEVRDHPAVTRLRLSPNPAMTAAVYKSTIQGHVLIWGNGYSLIVRNTMGDILELWPLPPSETKPRQDGRHVVFDTIVDGKAAVIPADQVLHIPALSRDGLVGMSPIREQREMLGTTIATQRFASKFFANGARPSGLMSVPGKLRDAKTFGENVQKNASGENANSLMVVDQGATFTPFAVPPDDAQFLQTREFSVDEVGRMFHLPLHFLNKMGQATFNNLEMMGAHFVQQTMMPWIVRWEQELSRKLLSEDELRAGLEFKINTSALVRGDIKTRSELYDRGIKAGWLMRNEARALEDYNPIDGLSEPLIPVNMAAIDDEPADDPVDEPGTETDSQGTETNSIRRSAFDRLQRKEIKKVSAIARNAAGQIDLAEQLSTFYKRHAGHLRQSLAWDEATATAFCRKRATEIIDAGGINDIKSVCDEWERVENEA
jgi:HK97 family phage portal protein